MPSIGSSRYIFSLGKKKCRDSLQYAVQGRKLVHYSPNLCSFPQSEGEGDLDFSAKLSNCSFNLHFTHLQSRSAASCVICSHVLQPLWLVFLLCNTCLMKCFCLFVCFYVGRERVYNRANVQLIRNELYAPLNY